MSGVHYIKRLIERGVLKGLGYLPRRAVRHLLFLLRSHPSLADSWGYHIRPIHYYEPLPDFREITEARLLRRRDFPAIDFSLNAQLDLLAHLSEYKPELTELADAPADSGFDFHNEYFAGLDAAVYYALVRHLKPNRIIEIGAGYSTRIANHALRRNRTEGREGLLTCIEPYPEPRLTDAKLDMRLIKRRVEDVDLDMFAALTANDILFIDSSHTVKFGSDVCHECLEILPILQPGVWVHVHDIFFPNDYPAEWLIDKRIVFAEQYLLEAFLAFNRAFSVKAANYWLSVEYPVSMEAICPLARVSTVKTAPSSLWMRREG